jgi:hypothetical protein
MQREGLRVQRKEYGSGWLAVRGDYGWGKAHRHEWLCYWGRWLRFAGLAGVAAVGEGDVSGEMGRRATRTATGLQALIVEGASRFSLYSSERVDWGRFLGELRRVAKGIKFAKGKLFTHDQHYAG